MDINNEIAVVKENLKRKLCLDQIIGNGKHIQELKKNISSVSSCDVPVLITGETGTGKELVARTIHYLSNRASRPFTPVNCGAIPESLFENELFGHEKGAYTDARFQQTGIVKEAEGGTLFLDEIGSVSPYIQIKFLRLLQEKEYKPLGDSKSHKANIRIIAATNRDMLSLVQKGSFREDLFYRLNIVPLFIPSLRERKEDIPLLIKHFLKKYSVEYNKPVKEISPDVLQALISYSWPGNIRELENKIQQIIVIPTSSSINSKNILFHTMNPQTITPDIEYLKTAKKKAVSSFEKSYLVYLLQKYSGDMVSAAKKSGKSRTALWNLLKKYDLSPKQFRI